MGLRHAALDPLLDPFKQVHVALDLETTGLDSDRDNIIEIGAVKFQGAEIVDTFQTFVNPARPIPEFIQRLTGISPNQVADAPFFSTIAGGLEQFLGSYPIIGHNISFDLRFLGTHNLPLSNTSYDTWDLASVLLPTTSQYSLGYLAAHLGIAHDNAHRALDDAKATQEVFLALLRRASELDPGLLAHLASLAQRSDWSIAPLLSGLEHTRSAAQRNGGGAPTSLFGLTGLDLESLSVRLGKVEQRRADPDLRYLDEEKVAQLLSLNGPFAKAFPGFEHRPEQEEMLAAVTQAVFQGKHLVVEGGTGVGKSMAYLLPAALFALSQGQRVVISTNTINLQEQLMTKDIPAMVQVLEQAGMVQPGQLKAALLKGRSNYLCLRRWNYLNSYDGPSVDDARLLGKTSVWLQETTTGDRGEINLSGRDAFTWSKTSAGEGGWCPGLKDGGPCFLRAARERADQAHIVVVNHALLLSDLARGGNLIPEYQHLIIDEAHNLEDAATRQLGFQIGPDALEASLDSHSRLNTELHLAMAAQDLASPVRQEGDRAIGEVAGSVPRLNDLWSTLWAAGEQFFNSHRNRNGEGQNQLLLNQSPRGVTGGPNSRLWEEVTLAWENLEVVIQQTNQGLNRLVRFLQTTEIPGASDQQSLLMETGVIQDSLEQLRGRLSAILGGADPQSINWLAHTQSRNPPGDLLSFNSAPLDVGATLAEQLFDRKESVVLTSATVSTEATFEYIRQRTGLPRESNELLVGSPFDYQKAALLLIPEDMPAPNQDGYMEALARVLADLGKTLGGHTMALFTSYSALRGVAQRLRPGLTADGIDVLAQSIDGSPQQLMSRFAADPHAVLLGTSSFWEGVDLPSGVLKALVLTRLPFHVPTDPIAKTRSEQYDEPFKEYSIPQAVLRFRQGIGRLIRNKGDKGSLVVLDRRITGRGYGQSFLKSIPPCTLKPSSLNTVAGLTAEWIGPAKDK
jgi:predicted DnaQ family exonuclease/DinG family helicase